MSKEPLDEATERLMMKLSKKLGGGWVHQNNGKLFVMLNVAQAKALVKKIENLAKKIEKLEKSSNA